jgi:hypothetical protein
VREPELAHDRELVEVDALAEEPVTLEDEVRAGAAAERPARWRKRPQRSRVRAAHVDLDDHMVVCVVQRVSSLRWSGNARRVSAK